MQFKDVINRAKKLAEEAIDRTPPPVPSNPNTYPMEIMGSEILIKAVADADEARKDPNLAPIMDKLDRISAGEPVPVIEEGVKTEKYYQPSIFPEVIMTVENNLPKDYDWKPRDAHWKDAYSKDRPWVFESGEWKIVSDGDATGTKIWYKGKYVNGVQDFGVKVGLGQEGTELTFKIVI